MSQVVNFPDSENDRSPPKNIGSEQALLGAILANNECYFMVADFLLPEDFNDHKHQLLFGLFQDHIESGNLVNPVTLANKIKGFDLDDIGGTAYLARLASKAITTAYSMEYGHIIKDASERRQVIEIAARAIKSAFDMSEGTATDIIESLENDLHQMSGMGETHTGLEHISGSLNEAIESVDRAMNLKEGEISGVTTGLKILDTATGGLCDNDLIILAGRPAMGKTALALNIVKGAAKAGHNCAFFSLEMAKKELGMRLISDMTHNREYPLSYFKARQGQFDDYQFKRFKDGAQKAAGLPIEITDRSNASIGTIRLECLKLRRKLEKKGQTLDLVVIDYMQLMNAGERYAGNRTSEVTEISRSLKNMAKEFDCPFLVLSQLSRNLEHRDDKRPIMSDLRESGAIEQDADLILFVYREHEYIKNKEPKDPEKFLAWQTRCERLEQEMEVIIAKQRNGPTGKYTLKFFKETSAVRG